MGKWFKWILILLAVSQIYSYFHIKNKIPPMVVALIEKNGCEGYEVFGMDLPFNYFFNTETETTIYLTDTNKSNGGSTKLKVTIIDTSLPFLKGIGNLRYEISGEEVTKNFYDCWKKE